MAKIRVQSRGTETIVQVHPQRIANPSEETRIVEPTELGEALKNLNQDVIETHTGMSSIDTKARLHPIECASVLALDALVQLRVCPTSCLGFTRQKKRLSVSVNGEGRKEIVQIVAGKRDLEERTGIMGRIGNGIKNVFSGGKME